MEHVENKKQHAQLHFDAVVELDSIKTEILARLDEIEKRLAKLESH